jgi:hypothetical protein
MIDHRVLWVVLAAVTMGVTLSLSVATLATG